MKRVGTTDIVSLGKPMQRHFSHSNVAIIIWVSIIEHKHFQVLENNTFLSSDEWEIIILKLLVEQGTALVDSPPSLHTHEHH